jgi:diadenosine tetraphosphatase ApaH/serine/threonine PP2A family protein phosphatase
MNESNNRTFIIGDVHGCLDELKQLVCKLDPRTGDRFVFVGDLGDRGPDSLGVIRYVKQLIAAYPGSVSIAGNHESTALSLRDRFLKTGEWAAKTHPWQKIATEEDWAFLGSLPLLHRIPEHDVIVVHGGFFPRFFDLYGEIGEPRNPWRKGGGKRMNRMRRFLFVRNVDEKGDMVSLNDTIKGVHPHWTSTYDGQEGFAVFGHDCQLSGKPFETENAVGIDTACVFGGNLTALVLSDKEREYVSVPAIRQYAQPRLEED